MELTAPLKKEIIENLGVKACSHMIGTAAENDLKNFIKKNGAFLIHKFTHISFDILKNGNGYGSLYGELLVKLINNENIEFYKKQLNDFISMEKEGFHFERLIVDGSPSNALMIMNLLSMLKFPNIKYFHFLNRDVIRQCCVPSNNCLYDHQHNAKYNWNVEFPFQSFPNLIYFCWEDSILPFDYKKIPNSIKHLRLAANYNAMIDLKPKVDLRHLENLEIIEMLHCAHTYEGNTLGLGLLSTFPKLKSAFVYYSHHSSVWGIMCWDLLFPKCSFDGKRHIGTKDYKFPTSLKQIALLGYFTEPKEIFRDLETLEIKERNPHVEIFDMNDLVTDPKVETIETIPSKFANIVIRFVQNEKAFEMDYKLASKSKVLKELILDNQETDKFCLETPFPLKYVNKTFLLCENLENIAKVIQSYELNEFEIISNIYHYYDIEILKDDIIFEWKQRIHSNLYHDWFGKLKRNDIENNRDWSIKNILIQHVNLNNHKSQTFSSSDYHEVFEKPLFSKTC